MDKLFEFTVHSKESGFPIYQTKKNPIVYDINPPLVRKEEIKKVPVSYFFQLQINSMKGAFVLHNVLTKAECDQFKETTEKMNFEEAPLTTKRGMIVRRDVRSNKRVMWQTTHEIWEPIWERIKTSLPDVIELHGKQWVPFSLNERLRFYRCK